MTGTLGGKNVLQITFDDSNMLYLKQFLIRKIFSMTGSLR